MILNHINLPVTDVAATRDFLTTYFGLKTVFELPKSTLTIMRDDAGLVLNLSHFGKNFEVHYHKDFHVGFFMPTRAEVDALHARMIADGLTVDTPRHQVGRYGFYIDAPGGFVTEVASFEGEEWAKP